MSMEAAIDFTCRNEYKTRAVATEWLLDRRVSLIMLRS